MIDTIYIEIQARDHPRTQSLLSRFKNARHVSIEHYSEVFNKRSQNFRLQKIKPALIIAKKRNGHILPAPEGFGIGGTKNFYFAHMNNCLYDCRYCFLQGMYTSANYVLFINFEDFDTQIQQLVRQNPDDNLTFFSGYDCDSLALESITGFVAHILPVFKKLPSSILEIRTKSIQISPLEVFSPLENCIIAFSLMPEVMSRALDHKAPTIDLRIKAMIKLANSGWKIGLRFDPLIHGKNWRINYQNLFERVFESLPSNAIHSVSFGPLRFPKNMFKDIVKLHPKEQLFSVSLPEHNGIVSYEPDIEQEMAKFCRRMFAKFVPDTIVFQCSPNIQTSL
ncbi:MAG: DNA photolyase [Pseudomonadota bacterium]|nr:DNA photolyase [Pseudomonadota bacterium]